MECRRRTGSPLGVSTYFPKQQVRTAGTSKVYVRGRDSGRGIRFHFCLNSGATVFWNAEFVPERIDAAVTVRRSARRSDIADAPRCEAACRAASLSETSAMMIRGGGFYHDDDPQGRPPRDTAILALLLLIVSAVGSAVVVLARAFLLTARR